MLASARLDLRMATPPTVLDIDWSDFRNGTRIYATIKIEHTFNTTEDLVPVFDDFCEGLPLLLIQQDTSIE